jgi:hypothetical protein
MRTMDYIVEDSLHIRSSVYCLEDLILFVSD